MIWCFGSSETKSLQIQNNAPELTGAFQANHWRQHRSILFQWANAAGCHSTILECHWHANIATILGIRLSSMSVSRSLLPSDALPGNNIAESSIRWGYENWTVVEDVVNSFERFGIPLETIWTDIDWMFQYRDFENDPIRFGYKEGEAFLGRLHASGRHYVPIIDSAIYVPNPQNGSDAYQPFDDGNATGSFLLNPDGSLMIGEVWPGYTVFPDWFTKAASAWWRDQMVRWHQKIPIDGIWIDMSECSSFCVGSCGSNNLSLNPVHPPFK